MTNIQLSILVPFYNEEKNILMVYNEICIAMQNVKMTYEMVFVNDGSSDGTEEVIEKIVNEDSRVIAIHLARNFGQTAAMSAAIDFSKGRILIGMDGDGQNDPADIPILLERLNEGYDVVSGWRKDRKDRKLTRRIPSQVANWLISIVSGVILHDYGCSLKAYRREVISEVKLYGEMHRFIPIYTSWMGGRISEIEVNHRPRIAGKSKYGLHRVWKVILDLLVIKFLDRYMAKPIHFFGGIGALVLALGAISAIWAVLLKLLLGVSFVSTPLPLLTVLFVLVGVMLIMQGMLAEVLMRTYFEGQQKTVYRLKSTPNSGLK